MTIILLLIKIEEAPSVVWMRCSLVNLKALTVNAHSATVSEFHPSILRHARICGVADEAVLNKLHRNRQKLSVNAEKNRQQTEALTNIAIEDVELRLDSKKNMVYGTLCRS
jgi:hypothetical protein